MHDNISGILGDMVAIDWKARVQSLARALEIFLSTALTVIHQVVCPVGIGG
jgi:hypothetical protein